MIPALSQVCSLNSPFEKDIEDYAAGACHAIEIWLGKLESFLETHSIDDVRRLLDQHQVTAPVASYQGGLLTSQADARREHWNHFERRLSLCRQLEINTLVVAGDIGAPFSQQDLDRVRVSIIQAADRAAEHDMRLAFEFQARAAFANNVETAAALVAECDRPQLGLCLDSMHYYCGPSKSEDLAYLTSNNLYHVQLCDLAGTPRELAADSDRVLPGDGDFVIDPLVHRLRDINYAGCVSVELMNPRIWQIPPRQFGEIAMTALRKLLGLATMD